MSITGAGVRRDVGICVFASIAASVENDDYFHRFVDLPEWLGVLGMRLLSVFGFGVMYTACAGCIRVARW